MRKHLLTIAFFLLLAAGFLGTCLNLGATFSPAERRVLRAFPKAQSLSLAHWTWDDDMEEYLSDHLVLRDALTGISAYMRLLAGTERFSDIYVTRAGQLVESPVPATQENLTSLAKNLRHLDELAAREGKGLFLLVPPSAGYAARENLPGYLAPLYADDELLRQADACAHLRPVDLIPALTEGQGARFYRTDNHWNADGAYAAYAAFLQAKGLAPAAPEEIRYETYDDFHGSTLSRSALWLTPHEPIRYPLPPCDYEVEIDGGAPAQDLYHREALTSYDPYDLFFGGNFGRVKLTNRSGGEGSLLLIKDSFANALVPLLLPHYRTILMIDPRFFRGDVHELIEQESIEEMACVCSLKTLATDAKLLLLR